MARKKAPKTPYERALALMAEDDDVLSLAHYSIDHINDHRFNDLHDKEAYYRGTAYDKRPFDWNSNYAHGNNIPLGAKAMATMRHDAQQPVALRQPNAKLPLARTIVHRFASLLFGESRFPHVQVKKSLNTQRYINEIIEQAQMKLHMLYAATLGGAVGSVITMFKVVDGRFRLESFNTKWVIPLWEDFHEGEMSAFCVTYPFTKYVFDKAKKQWVLKPFIYRRVVTKHLDIEFVPQEAVTVASANGMRVKPKDEKETPKPNPERTFAHDLGFVPAQFIQHTPRFDQTDGDAACETAYSMIDRINENLSAIHHAMQGNLDPTLVLRLTPEDYRKLQTMGGVVQTGADGDALVVGKDGDAKFIEITCEGIKVALEIVQKQIEFVLLLCDCVVADPHKITGAAQSAAAIQLLYAPMLSKTDILRTQYGENGLKRLIGKMLRAYHAITEVVEGAEQMEKATLEAVHYMDPETEKMVEVRPDEDVIDKDVKLVWGQYFESTVSDVFQAAEAMVMATGNRPVTTPEVAATFMARFVGDLNIENTVAKLKQYEAEQQAQEEKMATLGKPAAPSGSAGGGSNKSAKKRESKTNA